jgi:hypothetical protein
MTETKQMRDLLFWVATALYVVAITSAYLNRGSEKVVTTLGLGVVALLGSLIAVALFGSEPSKRMVFSVPIIIHADTRLPFEGLAYPVLPMEFAIQVREKLTAHPEFLPDPGTDSFAQSVYHHALQRAMIYWLEQKYPVTWQVNEFPMTLGEISGYSFQSQQVPSRLYLAAELKTRMSGNKFADIEGIFGNSKFGLALPKGTELTISTPHFDPDQGEASSIRLHNRFCTITIGVRDGMSMVGAGSYRMLFGMSQLQAQQAMKSDQYIVVISTTFNPLLAGNPEMPSYKKWASDIASGLETQFGDEVVWSKTRDWLLFHRVAGF